MKILIASDSYVFQLGGVANAILALIDGLEKNGHEVRVLAPANCWRSYKEGINYFMKSVPAFYYPDQRISPIISDPLLDELSAWHPDIIHIHQEGSMSRLARAMARKHHIPVVMTSHTDYAYFVLGRTLKDVFPLKNLVSIWGRIAYGEAKAVTVPSEKGSMYHQLKLLKDRVVVIPNGVRAENYNKTLSTEDREMLYKKHQLHDNGKTLVMISRLSKEKNVAGAIYCMLRMSNIQSYDQEPTDNDLAENIKAKGKMHGWLLESEKNDPLIQSKMIKISSRSDKKKTIRSPQEFSESLKHVEKTLEDIGKSIIAGEIQPSPYKIGTEEACTYCEYHDICRFDPNIPGYKYRDFSEASDLHDEDNFTD